MPSLREVIRALDTLAPTPLAEGWDNVGLLVGDENASISRAMTCLTVTEQTLAEAIEGQVELILAHHPLPFQPLKRITTATTTGKLLLTAIRAGIAIYSAHTAWDNAPPGINRSLADLLQLQNPLPLALSSVPELAAQSLGSGRFGNLPHPMTVDEVMDRVFQSIPEIQPRATHPGAHLVKRIGIVCGSGGSCLSMIAQRGCDAMLTGEATYHQCLEAEAQGIALMMIGHFASERFGMQRLAQLMSTLVPEVEFHSSLREHSRF